MPGEAVRIGDALVVAEDDHIVGAAVLRDIALPEARDVAFEAVLNEDLSLEFLLQRAELRIQPAELLPAYAIEKVPAGVLRNGDGRKPELGGAQHVLPRAALAVAVISMGMKILDDSHFRFPPA